MTLEHFCLSPEGRINRLSFWLFQAIGSMVNLLLWFIVILILGTNPEGAGFLIIVILLLFGLPLIYVSIMVNIKRLHDINKSGKNLFWLFLPIIGPLYLLVLMGFIKGKDETNQYGEPFHWGK